MKILVNSLNAILAGLRAAIAAHAARDRARAALFVLLWSRVGRVATRFETLFTKWRAGTLPKPRRPRNIVPPAVPTRSLDRVADQAEAGTPQTPTRSPQPYIPEGRAWLVVAIGHPAAGCASQLQHLLAQPECAEFLAAVPQAGRLLRPLCRLLGLNAATRPRRPAKPRPPRPPKPAKIPLWQCYPQGIRPMPRLVPLPPRRKFSPA